MVQLLVRDFRRQLARFTLNELIEAQELFALSRKIRPEQTDLDSVQQVARGFGWSPAQVGTFLVFLYHRGMVK